MELVVTEKELNTRQKRFLEEYHSGPHQGNGTEAYRAAYEVVGKELSDATCGSCASTLLRDSRMIAYLRTLREEQTAKLQDKLRRWEDLAPAAQAVVVETMHGTSRSRMRYEAALVILDRALGRVANRTELEVYLDSDGVSSALHALANRRLLGDGR